MLALELGQVADASVRRALEQISLRWPAAAQFYVGTGTPAATLGVDGAVYLNLTTRGFYGPKAAGAWPATPIGTLV